MQRRQLGGLYGNCWLYGTQARTKGTPAIRLSLFLNHLNGSGSGHSHLAPLHTVSE
jgi:hypothetical protein